MFQNLYINRFDIRQSFDRAAFFRIIAFGAVVYITSHIETEIWGIRKKIGYKILQNIHRLTPESFECLLLGKLSDEDSKSILRFVDCVGLTSISF